MITLTKEQRRMIVIALATSTVADLAGQIPVGADITSIITNDIAASEARRELVKIIEGADTIAVFPPVTTAAMAKAVNAKPIVGSIAQEIAATTGGRRAVMNAILDNADRAERGEQALLTTDYDGNEESDKQMYMGDVIANLLHLANRDGLDFGEALDSGRMHYEEEVAEEADEESGADV